MEIRHYITAIDLINNDTYITMNNANLDRYRGEGRQRVMVR